MANMFSGNLEKKVPKNFKECCKTDNTSLNLWTWCERLETWGQFLFWFIIAGGVISIIASMINEQMTTDLFIITVVETGIWAFVEYCAYHVIALLIASLATIVQNTRISANIALYHEAKAEGFIKEEPKSASTVKQSTTVSPDKPVSAEAWSCVKCGRKNPAGTNICSLCGQIK